MHNGNGQLPLIFNVRPLEIQGAGCVDVSGTKQDGIFYTSLWEITNLRLSTLIIHTSWFAVNWFKQIAGVPRYRGIVRGRNQVVR
jgi:hypothetical protein